MNSYFKKKFFLLTSVYGRNFIYAVLKFIHRDVIRKSLYIRDLLLSVKRTTPDIQIDEGKGYAILPPYSIEGVKEVVAESMRIFESSNKISSQVSKQYLRDIPIEDNLSMDSPFLKLALNPKLLSVVTQYLGVAPILREIKMRYSPNQEMMGGSQYFHTDKEDLRSIKVFIFISDADDVSGPLTALSAKASENVIRSIRGPWQGIGRFEDEEVLSRVSSDDIQKIYGPSGTVAFLDVTRCLHFGSRPNLKEPEAVKPRLVVWFLYQSRLALEFPFSVFGNKRYSYHTLLNAKSSDVDKYLLA
jgi:hypothetical protein